MLNPGMWPPRRVEGWAGFRLWGGGAVRGTLQVLERSLCLCLTNVTLASVCRRGRQGSRV